MRSASRDKPRLFINDGFLSPYPQYDINNDYSPLSPRSNSPLSGISFPSRSVSPISIESNDSISGSPPVSVTIPKKGNYRQLANKLDGDPRLFQSLYYQVIGHFNTIAIDPSGNYLCQSLIEHADEDKLDAMLHKMTGSWLTIVNHPHGTRVAQKLTEFVSVPAHYNLFVRHCMAHLDEMMRHSNGNHVIRKVVQNFPFIYTSPIYQSFLDHLTTFSEDKYGVCVIQNALDVVSEATRLVFYEALKPMALSMITDKYANYLVQYVLDKAPQDMVEQWIGMFVPELQKLCRDQCASNVIEKAIKYASPAMRQRMIKEFLLTPSALAVDPFGNYVLQTALEYSDRHSFSLLSQALNHDSQQMKLTPFGRNVLNKMAKVKKQLK